MPESQLRKLVAILAADIAGYSALMGSDEARTVRDLKGNQAVVLPMIGEFGGRIIDTAGDGILAEFASVVGAVDCAVAIQAKMAERNATIEPERRMQFRIGVNIGDVIYDEARIYGDGINIAARLEGIAEPGCIFVSRQVFDQVDGKVALSFRSLGSKNLKNITKPVEVFAVDGVGESDAAVDFGRDFTVRRWFLSYNSQDLALMQGLEAALKRKDPGGSVYFAPKEPAVRGLLAARACQGNRRSHGLRAAGRGKGARARGRSSNIYEALDRRVKQQDFPVVLVLLDGQPAPGLPFLRQLHWIITADPASEKSVAQLMDAAAGGGAPPGELWRHTAPYRGLAAMTESDSGLLLRPGARDRRGDRGA